MDDKMLGDLIHIKIIEHCRNCGKNDVVNEQVKNLTDKTDNLEKSVVDIYGQQSQAKNWVIGLLITIILSAAGYFGVKVMDKMLDNNIEKERIINGK